jgi:hypothetical protein
VRASEDWQSLLDEWNTSMADATAKVGMKFILAKSETEIPNLTGTLVRVTVNDYRYVSQVKRYMLGIMAGNAFMDLNVEYMELPGRKALGAKRLNTTTSAWQGIFSAATPKQVEAVSAEILRDIRGQDLPK